MEELAYTYVQLTSSRITAIDFWIGCAGGMIALLFHKPGPKLPIAPYFIRLMLCIAAMVFSKFVWSGVGPMMAAGKLWVLVLAGFTVTLLGGYLIGIFAQRRSVDAFGNAAKAYLAFVPLGNLWLLFKASLQPAAVETRMFPLLARWAAGTLGVVLLLVSLPQTKSVGAFVESAAAENPLAAAPLFRHMAQSKDGVKAALRMIADQGPAPALADQSIKLDRIAVEGSRLIYLLSSASEINIVPASISEGLRKANCKNEAIRPILEGGGTLEYVFRSIAQVETARFQIDKASCQ